MKIPRRRFLGLAAGAAVFPAVSRIARAQTYPTRPVRLLVGFVPGGGADILARLMGQWLSDRLGQPFIVENRAGAGGNVATEAAVRAPGDGHVCVLPASEQLISIPKMFQATIAVATLTASTRSVCARERMSIPISSANFILRRLS
jgi:tripartite-type tricarboxylate transporter receptor subunit TctC